MKLCSVPIIEEDMTITTRECEAMLSTRKFKSPEGTVHRLELGVQEIFRTTDLGLLHMENNKVKSTV